MLSKNILFLFLLLLNIVDKAVPEDHKQGDATLKLNKDQVMDVFKSVASSKYLESLAKEFSMKAAQYFLNEIKNKENQLAKLDYNVRAPAVDIMKDTKVKHIEPSVLNEFEAMNLLKDPSPDGDNLDFDSPPLSGEVTEHIPVMEVMKVNGRYYRRLLWFL